MRRHITFAAALTALALSGPGIQAQDQQDASSLAQTQDFFRTTRVSAALQSENEVPAVSSPARGRFTATISDDAVQYEVSYDGLQAPVLMAHIHLAQANVNGGIMVWLCGTTAMPGPTGTQTCPQSGTITGTITAANVGTITPQGIAAGDFDEFVAALRRDLAYVNIHSTQSPGGEIRGQVRRGFGHR